MQVPKPPRGWKVRWQRELASLRGGCYVDQRLGRSTSRQARRTLVVELGMCWHAKEGAPTTYRLSPWNFLVNTYDNWCTRRPLLPYANTQPISAPPKRSDLHVLLSRAPSSHALHTFVPPRHDHQ